MNPDLWTASKSAAYQFWTWLGNAVAENPLISLAIIGVILLLWWALKPKF